MHCNVAARSQYLAPARPAEQVKVYKLDSQDTMANMELPSFISRASHRMKFILDEVEEAPITDIGRLSERFGALQYQRSSPEVQA